MGLQRQNIGTIKLLPDGRQTMSAQSIDAIRSTNEMRLEFMFVKSNEILARLGELSLPDNLPHLGRQQSVGQISPHGGWSPMVAASQRPSRSSMSRRNISMYLG